MTSQPATTSNVGPDTLSGLEHEGHEVQEYGKVRLVPLALSHDARLESCQLLNQILADTMILYSLYKKHHWAMHGPTFYQLHLLLDQHAEAQLALIDALAERVQALGGVAIADPRQVAEVTSIDRPPAGIEEVPSMLSRLLGAHETILEETRTAAEKTDRNNDDGSNDLLVSSVLRTNETQAWILGSHLFLDAIRRTSI